MAPNTSNTSAAAEDGCAATFTDSEGYKIFKTVLFSIIMCAALTGNLFVLFIVYKKKNLRRTTNIFIANMAASDLLIAAIVIPRVLTELFIEPQRWIVEGTLGTILCKVCFVFADYSVCISATSHAVIAVDQFYAIVYSLRPSPITPARRKYIIAFIWLYGFILHSPNLYIYRLAQNDGKTYCRINWSPLHVKQSPKMFFTVIFIFVICIPVVLMIILYTWLVVSLTCKIYPKERTSALRRQQRKEDLIVLRNVVVIVTVFLVSLIPITVLGVLTYYEWDRKFPCDAWEFAFSAHVLVLSNSAINPWLCIFLHQSYRLFLQNTFCAKRRKMAAHTAKNHDLVSETEC